MKAKKIYWILAGLILTTGLITAKDLPATEVDYGFRPQIVVTTHHFGNDFFYASRIRRFHNSYVSFGFYSPVYTERYWYTYQPATWGITIYGGTGGFGAGYTFGYYPFNTGWYSGWDYYPGYYGWDYYPGNYWNWNTPVRYRSRVKIRVNNYYTYNYRGHNHYNTNYRYYNPTYYRYASRDYPANRSSRGTAVNTTNRRTNLQQQYMNDARTRRTTVTPGANENRNTGTNTSPNNGNNRYHDKNPNTGNNNNNNNRYHDRNPNRGNNTGNALNINSGTRQAKVGNEKITTRRTSPVTRSVTGTGTTTTNRSTVTNKSVTRSGAVRSVNTGTRSVNTGTSRNIRTGISTRTRTGTQSSGMTSVRRTSPPTRSVSVRQSGQTSTSRSVSVTRSSSNRSKVSRSTTGSSVTRSTKARSGSAAKSGATKSTRSKSRSSSTKSKTGRR